jgi:hyperosmotically inducible protein
MMKSLLVLLIGVVIGVAIVHFAFGPVDWRGVGSQTGETVSNAATVAAVRAALALQKDFELFGDIRVSAQDGIVTLSGHVATVEQRRLAVLISRGVEGVEEVVDELEIRAPREPASGPGTEPKPQPKPGDIAG